MVIANMGHTKTKSLLVFSGQVRPILPLIFNEHLKDFCKHMDVDIALFYWDQPGTSMNHDVNRKTNADLDVEEYLNLAFQDFRIIRKCASNERELSLYPEQNVISSSQKYSPLTKNAVKQLYQIYKANTSSIDFSDYDVVFRCRFDSLFLFPFKIVDLKEDTIYNINHGRAFFKNRIYDIFFYGKPDAMVKVQDTFCDVPYLVTHKINNNFDARDACHLLYQQAIGSGLKVDDKSIRYTDTFRNESVEKYLARVKHLGLVANFKCERPLLYFALEKLKFKGQVLFFFYCLIFSFSSAYVDQKKIINNASRKTKKLIHRILGA